MTKFHDEFFKKGDARHDALVLKCVSNLDNKLKIINAVQDAFSETFLPPAIGTKYMPHTVWICNAPHCRLKDIAHRDNHLICAESTNCGHYEGIKWCVSWRWEKKCNGFTGENAPLVPEMYGHRLEPQTRLVEAPLIVQTSTPIQDCINYESEVICTSGNGFILGYADLLFTISGAYSIYADLGKFQLGRRWNNFSEHNIKETKILIEVKPEIKEFGSILRQLKTYMKTLGVHFGAIVTYSEIQSDVIELLNRERIVVVKFEEDAPKRENSLEKLP